MLSLDQILLLQEKVEIAVEKISSLKAEVTRLTSDNDALRSKCAELTKALTEKTEQISNLETQHNQIEQGILNAMNQLDSVENSILSESAGSYLSENANHNENDSKEERYLEEAVENEISEVENEVLENTETSEISIPVSDTENQNKNKEFTEESSITYPQRNIDPNLDIF